jgi:hypothetical protein
MHSSRVVFGRIESRARLSREGMKPTLAPPFNPHCVNPRQGRDKAESAQRGAPWPLGREAALLCRIRAVHEVRRASLGGTRRCRDILKTLWSKHDLR